MTAAYRHAMPTAALLRRWLASGAYLETENGLERRCSKCREYWPADTEFFYTASGSDGLHTWCKACYREQRVPQQKEVQEVNNNQQQFTQREDLEVRTAVKELANQATEEALA